MSLSQWQRQWESSETERTLFRYKPKVTDRSQIDYPNTISYRNIAKLRLGYNQLRDYQFKLDISNNNSCECNQLETVEHYLLHCERYFNEREALRTHIFNTAGTPDLSCEFLLSCTKTDFRKIHEIIHENFSAYHVQKQNKHDTFNVFPEHRSEMLYLVSCLHDRKELEAIYTERKLQYI